jgi:uncharacterized protein YndB with AHSA1/START domain
MMMTDEKQAFDQAFAPIVKTLVVGLAVEPAFRLFTRRAGEWWPLASHSVGGDDAVTCVVDEHVGGRFYEVLKDGSQSEWGRVLVWEPPRRVVFSFYPGRGPDAATEVEVVFQPEPSGGTRLTLTHSGWERCAPAVQAYYGGYVSGWDYVLSYYIRQAA